ncbi:hypothetical protein [Aeromonas phage 51]|uniref:Uncharacterized protein n=3 Tax=Popoffvirus pv56 TaxID=2560283 RepID=A0A219YBD5_9CAUD|nr:hypothetical protein F394_gp44 [Aeromonas phage vB_AsaM-56]AFC22640.1 hypothetical protein AsaM-56_0044 [Aeromonas phage vB_AsaM-56]APU01267.1 hypothetical protein [Aeromonas phage 51]APU01351.1 hypothetical protein [Aeromonas phage 56]
MIDLDKIEQQCKGAIENGCGHLPVLGCGNAVKLMEVISRLRYAEAETGAILSMVRQAEKDAARYRWIKENSKFGVGRCGIDWELYFEGPAPDNSAMIELHIDEAMQCK